MPLPVPSEQTHLTHPKYRADIDGLRAIAVLSERIRRKTYSTHEEARQDVFDYIEVFYNRKRRHTYLGGVSPVEFETAASSRQQ